MANIRNCKVYIKINDNRNKNIINIISVLQ